MSLDEIKQTLENCGVVGAGGGGFPAHLKLDPRAKTILVNCAECEPLLQVDRQLLTCYTEEILHALGILAGALDASVVIAVKGSYTAAVEAVENMGGVFSPANFKIALLDNIYPIGDEIVLIYEALGITVPPGSLPIESGCIVFNVETVYNMYHALVHDRPVTHKWVTIAGEVENPVTVNVPVGTPIHEAVKLAGKITTKIPVFILGGPMMGKVICSDQVSRIPSQAWDNGAASRHPAPDAGSPKLNEITKTTGAILVLPADHTLVQKSSTSSTNFKRALSACCQCRTCTDMCPRNQLGHPIEPHRIMRGLSSTDTDTFYGTMYCSGCGVCETIACPQSLAPRALIKTFRTELSKAGIKAEKRAAAPISDTREGRLVNANRLKIRLGLSKYDVPAPLERI